ncbi:hypothetical protein D9M70_476280 [compost metagenome]
MVEVDEEVFDLDLLHIPFWSHGERAAEIGSATIAIPEWHAAVGHALGIALLVTGAKTQSSGLRQVDIDHTINRMTFP